MARYWRDISDDDYDLPPSGNHESEVSLPWFGRLLSKEGIILVILVGWAIVATVILIQTKEQLSSYERAYERLQDNYESAQARIRHLEVEGNSLNGDDFATPRELIDRVIQLASSSGNRITKGELVRAIRSQGFDSLSVVAQNKIYRLNFVFYDYAAPMFIGTPRLDEEDVRQAVFD